MSLTYIKGDVLYPLGRGNKIIAHICNNSGAWGGGFTKNLTLRWYKPKVVFNNKFIFELGTVDFVQVEQDIEVANMIAQVFNTRDPPIRYGALKKALKQVAKQAKEKQATVHMPKIGTGLARGSWAVILTIIRQTLVKSGINVYVYH